MGLHIMADRLALDPSRDDGHENASVTHCGSIQDAEAAPNFTPTFQSRPEGAPRRVGARGTITTDVRAYKQRHLPWEVAIFQS